MLDPELTRPQRRRPAPLSGQSLAELSLLLSLLAVAVIVILLAIGSQTSGVFSRVQGGLSSSGSIERHVPESGTGGSGGAGAAGPSLLVVPTPTGTVATATPTISPP